MARRKALMALMHGRRMHRQVTESNTTTAASRYDSMPLFVYWSTAQWLEAEGLAARSWLAGRQVVELTDVGVSLAEAQGL